MIIAIDGHSACGKSTLARDIAKSLGFIYIDSGAMYRAATLFFRQRGIPAHKLDEIRLALDELNIEIKTGSEFQIFLNDKNVTEQIRATEINDWVSEYASIPEVRRKMVELQRNLSKSNSIVMDGRDIGSVVFPFAELKIFMTADINVRTKRRLRELESKGIIQSFEATQSNLLKRDHIDSTRDDSPLILCEDAVIIDNSEMSREEQLNKALEILRQRIG